MKLNSKLTGGLAWAGLAIVLAVPTADLLTQSNGERAGAAVAPKTPLAVATKKAELVAPIPAVRTAKAVTTEKKPAVTRDASVTIKTPAVRSTGKGDVVDEFIASGKELPSYISDAPATAPVETRKPLVTKAIVPAVVGDAVTEEVKADGTFASAIDPIEVASVDGQDETTRIFRPSLIAPIPYPVSMRPTTPAVTTATVTTTTTPSVVNLPTTETEKPLILDEDLVARREAVVDEVLSDDFDPAVADTSGEDIVTGEELEEWDSGSLADYLERRNMLSKRSRAQVVTETDDEGFNIVERSRSERRLVRRLRDDELEFF